MKKQSKRKSKSDDARRAFLRNSAVAGAGATIATALPGAAMAGEPEQEKSRPDENYRVTKHISDYYKSLA